MKSVQGSRIFFFALPRSSKADFMRVTPRRLAIYQHQSLLNDRDYEPSAITTAAAVFAERETKRLGIRLKTNSEKMTSLAKSELEAVTLKPDPYRSGQPINQYLTPSSSRRAVFARDGRAIYRGRKKDLFDNAETLEASVGYRAPAWKVLISKAAPRLRRLLRAPRDPASGIWEMPLTPASRYRCGRLSWK
ncbi:hypothetical protein KM043_004474 [Ampulex compressa]|nr:hypothetical protein KM043_004474 [Ampulex compressa]